MMAFKHSTSFYYSLALMTVCSSPVFAGPKITAQHVETNDIVEYSLMGLKQSALNLSERNSQLIENIDAMQQEQIRLQQQLTIWQSKKERLELLSEDHSSSALKRMHLDSDERSPLALEKELVELQQEEDAWNQKLRKSQEEYNEVRANSDQLQKELKDLQEQVGLLDAQFKKSNQNSEWEKAIRAKKESEQSLSHAKQALRDLEKQNAKPLNTLKELQDKRNGLMKRIQSVSNELSLSLKEENDIKSGIIQFRQSQDERIKAIDNELADLKNKERLLSTTLAEAKAKIEEKNLKLSEVVLPEEQLRKNLDTITQENVALKEKMISLEERLEKRGDETSSN
jgi:chromosome segregation ATPase